jgi:Cobalamin biosynthesis protein CobN and related Mg-chelatases
MPLRVKKSEIRAGLSGQSGQALIEYVLILIITVSLVLMLMTQIFEPFQKFIQSYMGDYVSCLLETGELPSLGSDDTTAADEGCNKQFENASWTKGRPATGSGSTSTGSSSDSSSSSSSSSSDSDSSSSSGSSNSRYAGSNSRNGSRYFNTPQSRSSGLDGQAQGDGKTVEIALDNGGGGSFFSGNNSSVAIRQQRKVSYVPVTGLTEAEKKKVQKKEESKATVLPTGDGVGKPAKKTAVKKPEPKPEFEAEEKPFTIGNFIRILFIAAIIIAIVIFIGGQALQMSKSMEK